VFFLESCLLMLLHREAGYGYSLMSGLRSLCLCSEAMDISLLYRALRDLEAEGLVSSSWDEEKSLGPQRRMYAITAQGESVLADWMQALRQRRKELETLEAAYDAVKQRAHTGTSP
jgi:DNA-binding PadR family transcriptional regulator